MAKRKIGVEAVERKPQPPSPDGFHLLLPGLRKGLRERKDGTTGFVLYVDYDSRTVRYEVGPFAADGTLDMWLPRAEPGEVRFRLIDETDPEDPKALASGSA